MERDGTTDVRDTTTAQCRTTVGARKEWPVVFFGARQSGCSPSAWSIFSRSSVSYPPVVMTPLFFFLCPVRSHSFLYEILPPSPLTLHSGFTVPLVAPRFPSHVIPDRKSFIEKYIVRAGRNMTTH